MSNVTVPDERENQISDALALLKMEQDESLGIIDKLAVAWKLYGLSDEIRRLAQARLRGEQRPTPSLRDVAAAQDDPVKVASEWVKVTKELAERQKGWVEPALDSEIKFQMALNNYSHALKPLFTGLEAANGSGVPLVETHAKAVLADLEKARDTLQPVSGRATKEVENLMKLSELIAGELTRERPTSLAEVYGARARFVESIQAIRNAEDAIKKQTADLDSLCKSSQAAVETHIKAMVVAAVAWRESAEVREGVEWAETLVNGGIGAVQVLAAEPLSAVAVQGLHMLIKGVCDVINKAAVGIKGYLLSQEDALRLVDKLQRDDFIQAKFAAIQAALEWAAEPLGFIPSVGTLIRTAITTAGSQIMGTLKKAAENQAKAADPRQANVDEYVEQVKSVLKETIEDAVKTAIESAVETVHDFSEYLKGAKDPAELLLSIGSALFGPALQSLLAEVIPAFDLADQGKIRATIVGSRDALTILAKQKQEMNAIEQDFGFDEESAKRESLRMLGELPEGIGTWAMVAQSPEFESTGGVALLIGTTHSENNTRVLNALIQEGSGAAGTIIMKSKPGRIVKGELFFDFTDDKHGKGAEEMVRAYIGHYGSSYTSQTLTFK